MKPLIISLLGKSGSGKGTQGELLVKKFKIKHLSSGDLLRAKGKDKDFTGKKLAKMLTKGGLVPTPIVFDLWVSEVEKLKNKNTKGFLMDGTPRKLPEALLIDELFSWYGWSRDLKVFLIDISNKEAADRLLKRRICQKCKKIIPFIGEFKKIKECPKCKGKLIQRKDDNLPAVKKRLKWFKSDVMPVVRYYKKTKRLIKINGEQSIEDVQKDILKCIK